MSYSKHELVFPAHGASAGPNSQGLTEHLTHGHRTPYDKALDQGTYFTAKQVPRRAHDSETRWSHRRLYLPVTTSPKE